MDSDSIKSVFANYGDIVSVSQNEEFGMEWWVIEFTESSSVIKAKRCLSWKAIAHKGNKMVAFTMEGYLENQEIETKLQENHMLDFLEIVNKEPLKDIPYNSPFKSNLEVLDAHNELLSPNLDIWSSHNNELSLFSPSNVNQKSEQKSETEKRLTSPDISMRNSNNSDSVISSEHTPNVMTSKYQMRSSS